ncbi:MAG: histidine kinase dimerization/phospho-acceptor domain-containing protein, partial [Pseudomonadota bacterium]
MFSDNLQAVFWANASGAQLFGGKGVVELLDANLTDSQTFVRQLRNAIGQITDERPIIRGFRISSGLRSSLYQFEIKPIRFDDDSLCYRVVQKSMHQAPATDEHVLAQQVVESLEGFADAAAVLDDYGLPLSATPDFAELGPSEENALALVGELSKESDRLIKRPIQSVSGTPVVAGLGRISDDPGRTLVVLARADDTASTAVDEDDVIETPLAAPESSQEPAPVEPEAILATDIPEAGPNSADPIEAENEALENVSVAVDHEPEQEVQSTDAGKLSLEDESAPPDEGTSVSETLAALKTFELTQSNSQSSIEGGQTKIPEDEITEVLETGQSEEPGPADFVFTPSEDPVRFAFSIDGDGIFTSISEEFPRTLGPQVTNVVGRNWSDVSKVLGFDTSGEIAALLNKRDTWSGKTVLWPVEGTDLVAPIDLAALPAFGSERRFEGFRGFGIIRTLDAIIDPEETGLAFASSDKSTGNESETTVEGASVTRLETGDQPNEASPTSPNLLWFELEGLKPQQSDEPDTDEPDLKLVSDDDTDEVPVSTFNQSAATDRPSNIVQLSARTSTRQRDLSKSESEAFEKIGDELRKDGEGPTERTPTPLRNLRRSKQTKPDTSLIENLPVAVLVYRDGNILFANEKLLNALGHESLEAINKAGGTDAIFKVPEEIEGDEQGVAELLRADGTSIKVNLVLHSVPWDGEKALQLSFAPPVPTPSVEISALEITQASEIQSILDTTSDGIVLLNEDGNIISINASAEALFNRTFDDTTNKHFTTLFAEASHGAINQYVNSLAEPGVASMLQEGQEVIARVSAGGEFPVFLTVARLHSTRKLCAVIQDLTGWKKTEQELIRSRRDAERASEQKTDFLAQVSHEIRTPLNAIIGFSDIMIEERFGPIENTRYREYLRDIKKSGKHVLDLVNDLLDLSKIESGKLELTFDAVELNRCVTETVAMLQPQANAKRVIIRTSLSRAVPKVVADQRTIRQIIINLVTNAIKFSRSNSQVIVSTVYESSGEVALRVRDTGKGMTAEEINRALKPYQQIRAETEAAQEGTGLGLPLTKALVEANRAFFDIESEPGE